jgi:ATP-dependent HslUV protease ATP-binding subunit HslU
LENLTPQNIVRELDKYIVGQNEAKRKVAIALRNRWRRQQLDDDIRDEVTPKNIIMIGPTGVGKTEIARRLSKLVDAPFVKVEASKFTEVGYVGRDCESMIRDLVEISVGLVRDEMKRDYEEEARQRAENRILDVLLPPQPRAPEKIFNPNDPSTGDEGPALSTLEKTPEERTRDMIKEKLESGEMDDREIEVSVKDSGQTSTMHMFSNTGLEEMGINFQDMLGKLSPEKKKTKKTTISAARKLLEQEELEDLLDMDRIVEEAVDRAENAGIVFLDEVDKIAGSSGRGSGPDVSREGVQRDILPIVEGSTVTTKYGPVKTDHILFVAAGAFHISKVSDLIPELQGRFPIRVELNSLDAEDFARILKEPKNSLIRQYKSLLATEDVTIDFTDDAITEMANICREVNEGTENIGARRLHTIMEYLLESLLFDATEHAGETITIDAEQVKSRLSEIVEERDLSQFIL